MYRITVNDCLSWKRKRRFLFLSFDEFRDAYRAESVADAGRTHEEQAETADQVLKAMSHLSPKLRAVVALRYYRDLSYAEIATILSIEIGTVKSRLNQAMALLRNHLTTHTAEAIATNIVLPSHTEVRP